MFCKHEWKVLSEVTTTSKLNQLPYALTSCNGALILLELTTRKYILTVTCEKCGEIKQFVNEI